MSVLLDSPTKPRRSLFREFRNRLHRFCSPGSVAPKFTALNETGEFLGTNDTGIEFHRHHFILQQGSTWTIESCDVAWSSSLRAFSIVSASHPMLLISNRLPSFS